MDEELQSVQGDFVGAEAFCQVGMTTRTITVFTRGRYGTEKSWFCVYLGF